MRRYLLGIAALGAMLGAGPAATAANAAPECDRACLEKFVDGWLDAMIAKDIKRLPVTADVRYAESYQPIALGEGSWRTIDGLGKYRHYFADPENGQVGFIGTVTEHGAPGFIDLRLKIRDHKIAEAEMFLMRDPGAFQRYEEMGKPEDVWLTAVAPEQRASRADLIRAANNYFQGMQHNDGKGDYSFFHDECNRLEHALRTTNLKTKEAYGHSTDTEFRSRTCAQQFGSGFLGFVTDIRDRRFIIVDEERQALLAFASLDHNGTIRRLNQTDGRVFVLPDYFDVPRTLQVVEGFQLREGKLFRIEMTLTELPYGSPPAWKDQPATTTPGTGAAR